MPEVDSYVSCTVVRCLMKRRAGLSIAWGCSALRPRSLSLGRPSRGVMTGKSVRSTDTEGSFMVERVAEMADAVVRHLQLLASRRDSSKRPLVVRHLQCRRAWEFRV